MNEIDHLFQIDVSMIRPPLPRFRPCAMLTACALIVSLALILLLAYTIYSPPKFVIHLLAKIYPDVLFHLDLPPSSRYIAFTIDDFPNSHDLSVSFRLLDLLRDHNARCTFFTIGSNIQRHQSSNRMEELFQRIATDGHELGNHGWRDEEAIRLSPAELEKQIHDTQTLMNRYSNRTTKWFRPGSGFFNRTMLNLCHRLDYRLVLGSIYPHDPQIPHSGLNSYFIRNKLYPGAIIILHDRRATIETLEKVLPEIEKRSFHLVTLTELQHIKESLSSSR